MTTHARSRDVATPRRHRLTFRMRLALTYAGLLAASGALLLTLTAVFIIWLPTYNFTPSPTVPSLPDETLTTPMPLETGLLSDLSVPSLEVGSREDLMRLFLVVGTAVLLVVALLGGFIGWKIAGRMLAPLHEVSTAAKRAATGSLGHRIGLGTPRDEITELATTFDEMLDSLETAFHAHQRFAANASHELRTPLATTRAILDVALASGSPPTRKVLTGLREMNERSVDTVDALLNLADIEALPGDTDAQFDVESIVRASIDQVADTAEGMHLTMTTDVSPASLSGDPRLVRLLTDNLLLNAVRHNIDGGSIQVQTFMRNGRAVIRVENTGVFITAEQAELLTEPFVRLSGRNASGRGHGLGLAIVAAITRQHRADLSIHPRDGGGLTVTVTFAPSIDGTERDSPSP